jgi:hypothetical protein
MPETKKRKPYILKIGHGFHAVAPPLFNHLVQAGLFIPTEKNPRSARVKKDCFAILQDDQIKVIEKAQMRELYCVPSNWPAVVDNCKYGIESRI